MHAPVEVFFKRILSDKGFPVITTLKKGTQPQQFSFESLPEFFKAAEELVVKGQAQQREVYFCISTMEKRSIVTEEGKFRIRVGPNCKLTKVLVLDIDIDETGFLKGDQLKPCYKSKDEALVGIDYLCTELSFPAPDIVDSGYGLHVYWPFQEAISSEQWAVAATKFKAACGHIDRRVIADPTRITDRAGILRIPSSFNFKREAAQPVLIIQDNKAIWPYDHYREHLDAYLYRNGISADILSVQGIIPKAKKIVDLTLTYPDQEKPEFKEIYKKCNWFQNYMVNAAERSEPMWMAALDIAALSKLTLKSGEVLEGASLAIYLSKGYPGYDEKETREKFARSEIKGVLAARKCVSMEATCPAPCSSCKFKEHVTTPLQLPRMAAPVEAVKVAQPVLIAGEVIGYEEKEFPKPPHPFEIGEDGAIYMRQKNEDGLRIASRRIYDYTIIPVGRLRDDSTGNESIELELKLPHGDTKRFAIDSGEFQEERGLRKVLGRKGVYIDPDNMKWLTRYLIGYVNVIQRDRGAVDNYTSFGWKDRDTVPRFATYDTVISQQETLQYKNKATSLTSFGPYASCAGMLAPWREAFGVYEGVPGMEAHIITLMLSFGAPLLAFLDEFGLLYNLYGGGGEGKSSSLLLATSIWGQPTASHIMVNDTTNALFKKLGIFRHLPMSMDELTHIDDKVLSEFVYGLSLGRERDRLEKSADLRVNTSFWQTFVFGNSNHSLYEKLGNLQLGNNAHGYRILEFPAPAPNSIVNQRMHRVKEIIKSNYGLAGREFMRYVLANYDDVRARTRMAKANLSNSDLSRERFWIAAQACMQTAGYITQEMGLHNYEPGKLLEYMQRMAPREQVQSIVGDPISKLNEYILQNVNNTVRVIDERVFTVDMDSRSLYQIALRLEGKNSQQMDWAYIPVESLKAWCRKNIIDFTWMKSELLRMGVITRQLHKRIGAGTKHFSANAPCFQIDMNHPLITGVDREEKKGTVVQLERVK